MEFQGRTVVVTGGASGIGLATAHVLVGAGAHVVVVDRAQPHVRDAVAELATAEGLALDVTDFGRVQELIAEIAERPAFHGVVNAAGVLQLGSFEQLSEADWDRLLDVNLKGTFAVCRAALPALVRSGGGAIVNLASISGRTKSIHAAPNYVASKAGVIGLTMSLAAQSAAHGVRVNCVAPGVIDTPMTAVYDERERAALLAPIPAGRAGSAAEVAHVIASLLSDGWSYVTGQTINVSGGMFMQ